ncbi:MAG: hypothetical protein ACK53L_35335, partial [Pirellulaceae bacterium]
GWSWSGWSWSGWVYPERCLRPFPRIRLFVEAFRRCCPMSGCLPPGFTDGMVLEAILTVSLVAIGNHRCAR